MRIGIDGREFVKHRVTGISRFLFNMLETLTDYKVDWEFYVFLNQHCELSLEKHNIKKIVIPQKITFLWDQYLLLNEIKKLKLDLFYSPYYKFPVLTNIPTVTTIFDVTYLTVEPYKYYFKNNFFIKNFIRMTSSKVKKIITSSYSSKEGLVKLLKIKEEKIVVIYLFVAEKFYPQPQEKVEEIRNKYGINSKYILYVGNSNPHKNIKRLIEAYNLLSNQVKKEYILLLVGVKKSDVFQFIGNNKDIYIIEFIDDEDLASVYSGAELFVFPSLFEGFGYPPLEAMACGCPVVSSNVSSMPEILEDSALYFNPYDVKEMTEKIYEVLSDEVLRQKLKEKGLKQVSKFNKNNTSLKFIEIFEEAVYK